MVSLKLEKNILKEIDANLIKRRYSTRTEFIREAIREKIKELEKEELLKKYYGASKRKTTDEELHRVRQAAFEELEKEIKEER